MRGKIIGVVTIVLLAPVTAELLQAYLGDLGGPGGMGFLVVFLAPLYGGIALLIREVSVRTGRGWTGRLMLAAAFGVGMATIIDLSLFTEHNDDIEGWEDIVGAASLGGLGWSAVVTWVVSHVLMSVSAPMVVAESLARRRGPWLGTIGLLVVSAGFVLVAFWLHQDQVANYSPAATATEYTVAGAVVLALVGLALTPLGRPLPETNRTIPSIWLCVLFGFLAMTMFDLVPMSWAGVAVAVGVLGVAGWLLSQWARSAHWRQRHLALVVFGALLARTLIGFLAPLPLNTTWAEKISQNLTYLVIVLCLGWLLHHRTRSEVETEPLMKWSA